MHSVHQNQGDLRMGAHGPDQNAIWQDGATMTLRPYGDLGTRAFRLPSRVVSSGDTDEHGRPRRVTPVLFWNPLRYRSPVKVPVCTLSFHGDGSRPSGRWRNCASSRALAAHDEPCRAG